MTRQKLLAQVIDPKIFIKFWELIANHNMFITVCFKFDNVFKTSQNYKYFEVLKNLFTLLLF
jgi:hypothetical protein